MMPNPTLLVRAVDLNDQDLAQRIDAYVMACINSTPFHLTAWTRAIDKGCGQKSHYLVAEDGGGQIAGILPLTAVKSRLFGSALVSAGFAVDGGVLADSEAIAEILVARALDLARDLKCTTVELRGGALPQSDWIIDDTTYAAFVRDLGDSDDSVMALTPRKQKAKVNRSLERAFEVSVGTDERHRKAFFASYSISVRNLGTPVFPRSLFDAVLDEFGTDADILVIWYQGKPLSCVLSFYHKGVGMPYWCGAPAEARDLQGNDRMYFESMLHARKNKGCARYDFGRSKLGSGPDKYKINFGCTASPLVYAKRATDGGEIRDINPLSPKYRLQVAAWKKLPLWLANLAGPMIARGLG
jgi:FemAB-related protein (PEP-CTERM system-associated)